MASSYWCLSALLLPASCDFDLSCENFCTIDRFLEVSLPENVSASCHVWPSAHSFHRVIFISNLTLDLYSLLNCIVMTKSAASPVRAPHCVLYRMFLRTPTNRIHHTIIPIQVIAFLQAIRPRGPFVHRKLCS